jgi:hypothetical protein
LPAAIQKPARGDAPDEVDEPVDIAAPDEGAGTATAVGSDATTPAPFRIEPEGEDGAAGGVAEDAGASTESGRRRKNRT